MICLKKILLVVLVGLLFNSIAIAIAMAYPIKLDEETLLQAKAESKFVGKYGNDDVRQYSYMLGEKEYPFLNMQAPILIDMETPYSVAKYRFFRENTLYDNFTDNDKKALIDRNTIKLITRCVAHAQSMSLIPLPIKNVVVKKNGVVYKSVAQPVTDFYSVKREWILPIEVFDGSYDVEIIVIDTYDNIKPLKLTKEKLLNIK